MVEIQAADRAKNMTYDALRPHSTRECVVLLALPPTKEST